MGIPTMWPNNGSHTEHFEPCFAKVDEVCGGEEADKYSFCEALAQLHFMGIVHRNLKPEKILLSSPRVDAVIKIADLGTARMFNKGLVMKTVCSTPGSTAPEVLQNKGYDSGAQDMWSVGVIMYLLLCGFPPATILGFLLATRRWVVRGVMTRGL